jgi:ribokinase
MLDVIAPSATGRHGDVHVRPGGTAVTAALAARAAGADTAVAGRVGDDVAAHAIREHLARAGVEDLLVTDTELATGTYVELGETRLASRGANARLAAADVPVAEYDAVLVSGYVVVHDDTLEAARRALGLPARWRAVTVTPLARGDFGDRAAGANVVFANAAEAARIAHAYEIVCITEGARGATVTRDGTTTRLPPTGVTGTGAGDAFAGAYLAAL